MPRDSYTIASTMHGISYFCMTASYLMLRDGFSLWHYHFVAMQPDYIDRLKIGYIAMLSLSIVFLAYFYRAITKKILLVFIFAIGAFCGNVILTGNYFLYKYGIWTGPEVETNFNLGYTITFFFTGGLYASLVDFSFMQINAVDHRKAISIHSGVIYLSTILGQLFSWHALIEHKDNDIIIPVFSLIFSTFVLLFVSYHLYMTLYELKRKGPTLASPNDLELKTLPDKIFHRSLVLVIMICDGAFNTLKLKLMTTWLSYSNMTLPKFGNTYYTHDVILEQYIYSTLFACIIFKLFICPQGNRWPITTGLIGIILMIYTIHLAGIANYQIKHTYDNRLVYPDYDNSKMFFVNLIPKNGTIQFFRHGDVKLMPPNGDFTLDRLDQFVALKTFKELEYFTLYMWNVERGHWSQNEMKVKAWDYWNCPQILCAFAFDPLILNFEGLLPDDHKISKERLKIERNFYARCPDTDVYLKSRIFAYACLRFSPVDYKTYFTLTSNSGRQYQFTHYECLYLPPGIYELSKSDTKLIHFDIYDLGPGGSYYFFVSMFDSVLFKNLKANYTKVLPKEAVAFYKPWQKPLSMSVIFLLPQFIMLGIVEMLLFTSCLEVMYSTRENRWIVVFVAKLLAFGQWGVIFHMRSPSSANSISGQTGYFVAFFVGIALLILAAKALHAQFQLIAAHIRLAIERFKKGPIYLVSRWIKTKFLYFFRVQLVKLIAKDFQHASKYGICAADDPDDIAEEEIKQSKSTPRSKPEPKTKPPSPPHKRQQLKANTDAPNKKDKLDKKKSTEPQPTPDEQALEHERPAARGKHGSSKKTPHKISPGEKEESSSHTAEHPSTSSPESTHPPDKDSKIKPKDSETADRKKSTEPQPTPDEQALQHQGPAARGKHGSSKKTPHKITPDEKEESSSHTAQQPSTSSPESTHPPDKDSKIKPKDSETAESEKPTSSARVKSHKPRLDDGKDDKAPSSPPLPPPPPTPPRDPKAPLARGKYKKLDDGKTVGATPPPPTHAPRVAKPRTPPPPPPPKPKPPPPPPESPRDVNSPFARGLRSKKNVDGSTPPPPPPHAPRTTPPPRRLPAAPKPPPPPPPPPQPKDPRLPSARGKYSKKK